MARMKDGTRTAIWASALALFLLAPIVLLSNWGLAQVQGYVDSHAAEPWAADWQYNIATAYSWTMRPQKACWAFENASRLYNRNGNTDGVVRARYWLAVETEDVPLAEGGGKWVALKMYEELAHDFPDHPLGKEAAGAAMRIRTLSRP
jgi:hypothetical protein